jgi:hypothetical protein
MARNALRPSYRRGVEFIALNLDVGDNLEDAAGDIAVIAISEAFGKEAADVAAAVFRMRDRVKRVRAQTAARVRSHRARKGNAASAQNHTTWAPSTGAKGE